jgi:hypothetical protein
VIGSATRRRAAADRAATAALVAAALAARPTVAEAEILKLALEIAREETALAVEVAREGKYPLRRIAETLAVARSHLSECVHPASNPDLATANDDAASRDAKLIAEIKTLVAARPRSGYRRVATVLKRALRGHGIQTVNHKRVYGLMRGTNSSSRASRVLPIHDDVVPTEEMDQRWCGDIFQMKCWNGDRVHAAFALDCDRAAIAFAALPDIFDDYNKLHPHKALGTRSPAEFRETLKCNNAA